MKKERKPKKKKTNFIRVEEFFLYEGFFFLFFFHIRVFFLIIYSCFLYQRIRPMLRKILGYKGSTMETSCYGLENDGLEFYSAST